MLLALPARLRLQDHPDQQLIRLDHRVVAVLEHLGAHHRRAREPGSHHVLNLLLDVLDRRWIHRPPRMSYR